MYIVVHLMLRSVKISAPIFTWNLIWLKFILREKNSSTQKRENGPSKRVSSVSYKLSVRNTNNNTGN